GRQARVLEPRSLRQRLAAEAAAIVAHYHEEIEAAGPLPLDAQLLRYGEGTYHAANPLHD
ncbi:MAG TPA: hypothetical protein VIL85_15860, partial [Thermomicrobiales bacterium]